MKNNKRKTLLTLGVLWGILFFLGGAFWLQTKIRPKTPPRVIEASPALEDVSVSLLPEIRVKFDQKVSPSQIKLSSYPAFSFQALTKTPSETIKYIPLQPLEKNTLYKLNLGFQFGGEYSWEFKTPETEAGAIPGWAEAFQEKELEYRAKYPPKEVEIYNLLVEKMPYSSPDFWIEYAGRGETFLVHLCQKPFGETRQEAEEWFSDQGAGNLSALKLNISWLYGCEPPSIPPQTLPSP